MAGGRIRAKVGDIKAALGRLRGWLDADCGVEWGQHEKDLDTVLNALEATLKKPRNGRSVSLKGYKLENETRIFLCAAGLDCKRVPLSGAGDEKGDLRLVTGWGQTLKGECKSRKELAKWIVDALGDHDFVVLKQDRGETLVMVRLPLFRDMCQ